MKKLIPRKFIDHWEIVLGPNLIIPNADSWASFYNNTTTGSAYSISKKIGLSTGISLIHNIKRRFDIRGSFLWERRGYLEQYTFNLNNDQVELSKYNRKDDCLSISFAPSYLISRKNNIIFFSGATYSYLIKSRDYNETYLNDSLISKNTIKLDDHKTYGIFLSTGIDYIHPVGKKTCFFIRLQGNIGLNDIVQQNKYSVRTNNILLYAGLKIIR
ncbi:MAG: outer membrane beta-barrel protein [Bacteroidetes bacterium]|nr:outer membrane beta-barrel protein [Bacteroidota bacterium]